MPRFPDKITYSDKFFDLEYEYRNAALTKELFSKIRKKKLLTEEEWRNLGIEGSEGWTHYDYYDPEPHIILLRKLIKRK